MQDYFDEIHKALKEFHEWEGRSKNTTPPNNASYYSHPNLKPLYMLIKVEVDKDIVYNQDKAEAYAENHCNSLEYELCDWYYPDDQQYPYIAK
jgi:hypothetical protein